MKQVNCHHWVQLEGLMVPKYIWFILYMYRCYTILWPKQDCKLLPWQFLQWLHVVLWWLLSIIVVVTANVIKTCDPTLIHKEWQHLTAVLAKTGGQKYRFVCNVNTNTSTVSLFHSRMSTLWFRQITAQRWYEKKSMRRFMTNNCPTLAAKKCIVDWCCCCQIQVQDIKWVYQ